ncbi:MAG: hypothetical protein SAJ37_08720 [Oscillatoria sp. PMC 1068.18]|nr:hypothetical protein [Oscillatoria sp. PMC 1076.18]MEC4988816.1 hypothetical protein [Oscillatoria sp. PMC 1068.18]
MVNQHNSISSDQTTKESLFDKFFRDDQGNIVIAQKPNLPIILGVGATLIYLLLPNQGNLSLGLETVAIGALFTWGWMELFQGVNYFRRTLGLISLLVIIASRLHW